MAQAGEEQGMDEEAIAEEEGEIYDMACQIEEEHAKLLEIGSTLLHTLGEFKDKQVEIARLVSALKDKMAAHEARGERTDVHL